MDTHARRTVATIASLVILAIAIQSWTVDSARAASPTYTAFTIDGGPGAGVGGGVPQVYTDADSTFEVSDLTTPGWVILSISGTSEPANGHWYWANIAAPPGEDLHVGTYTGATRAAFRGPGEPGIDIFGDGTGCNTVAGTFTVHEISFASQTLTAFSATYSFTCEALSPVIRGEIRYASGQPFAGLRQLPIDRSALDFGFSNVVGVPSAPRTTQLVNLGATTIGLSDFSISGANPADYGWSAQTCGASLTPGASCSWDTTFTPTASDFRYAQANYSTDTYGSAHGQILAGYAQPALSILSIQPAEGVDFGRLPIGSVASQAFTISSAGNVAVSLGERSIVGLDAAEFSISADDCPAELAPTELCTVTVDFEPLTDGNKTAALTFAASDSGSPHALPLLGSVLRPGSGVTWGPVYKPGPAYTWTYGGTLGRTVRSGSQRLHLGYTTNRINGSWASDSGPRIGVYYVRSATGATWSTPKRLNPSTQHGDRAALTAAGSRVYVAWVSQTKFFNYSPTAPRVLYVRINTSHGDASAWKGAIRLTSTSGRVDYPTITASGKTVVIAWTDSITGDIRLAISRDMGVTWKKISIGSTSVAGPSGKIGLPSVAISGTRIAVSWVADVGGTVRLRTSGDGGASWSAAQTVGSQSNGYVHTAIRGTRIAVAWTTPTDLVVRVNTAGAWAAPIVVTRVPTDPEGAFLYHPVVVLQDPNRVGVAWSEQLPEVEPHVYQRWAESADGGVHWFATQTIATHVTTKTVVNDAASVLWPSASKRIVTWNGWTPGTLSYREFLRIGTGAPTTAVAGMVWAPSLEVGSTTISPSITTGPLDRRLRD